jgi:esterase/lipase superfamily enzyme
LQLVLAAPDVDARVFVEKQAAKLSAFRDFDLTFRGITPADPARQLQQKAELFLLQP